MAYSFETLCLLVSLGSFGFPRLRNVRFPRKSRTRLSLAVIGALASVSESLPES